MNVNVQFDETVLIKAVLDQVVQTIQDEFHKIFPRLRRDEIEAATQPLTGKSTFIDVSKANPENAEKMIDEIKKQNTGLKGWAFPLNPNAEAPIKPEHKVTVPPVKANVIQDYTLAELDKPSKEGFYFYVNGINGLHKFVSYHAVEESNV